jgi:hypothetical protein
MSVNRIFDGPMKTQYSNKKINWIILFKQINLCSLIYLFFYTRSLFFFTAITDTVLLHVRQPALQEVLLL